MMFSGATLRQDMLIMIGVLIAAWFVKVVVLFIYMTYYKRRQATSEAEGDAANPAAPPKLTSTPPEVIAALPVCAYRDLQTAGGSSSSSSSGSGSGGKISSGQDTAGQQQQQQEQEQHRRKYQRSDSDHLAWKPTAMDEVQSCGGQQQQQQAAAAAADTPPGKMASLFRVRLSLDSALTLAGRKHQRTNSSATAAAAAGGGGAASLAPAAEPSATAAAAAAVSAAPAAGPEEGETCAICFCEYEGPDLVKRLPQCGHFYHTDCIDTWLSRGTTCPLCKMAVWDGQEAQETQGEQQQQQHRQGDAVVVIVDGLAAEVVPSHVIVTVQGQPARA